MLYTYVASVGCTAAYSCQLPFLPPSPRSSQVVKVCLIFVYETRFEWLVKPVFALSMFIAKKCVLQRNDRCTADDLHTSCADRLDVWFGVSECAHI